MLTPPTRLSHRHVALPAAFTAAFTGLSVGQAVVELLIDQPLPLVIGLSLLMAVIAIANVYNAFLNAASRQSTAGSPPAAQQGKSSAPTLAVIIASCNEPADVARLTLDSAVRAGYPGPLRVIVVDNSPDDTTPDHLAWSAAVRACPGAVFRRNFPSTAKKPGNLDVAMGLVGDADFIIFLDVDSTVPRRSQALSAAVTALQADPRLAFVQFTSRATNSRFSRVARAAALWHDLRNRRLATASAGGFAVFYGHNAVWSTAVLRQLGGWTQYSGGQLMVTEDLLMAVRARLAGWHGLYLPHTFGEWVPSSLSALRTMWLRWAMGTQQVMRRLWTEASRTPRLTTVEKADLFLHAFTYLVPVGVYLVFLLLPFLQPSPVTPWVAVLFVGLWLLPDLAGCRLADLGTFLPIKVYIEAVCVEGFFQSFSGRLRSRWTPTAKGVEATNSWLTTWHQNRAVLGLGLAMMAAALIGTIVHGPQLGAIVTFIFGLLHFLPVILWHQAGRHQDTNINTTAID